MGGAEGEAVGAELRGSKRGSGARVGRRVMGYVTFGSFLPQSRTTPCQFSKKTTTYRPPELTRNIDSLRRLCVLSLDLVVGSRNSLER